MTDNSVLPGADTPLLADQPVRELAEWTRHMRDTEPVGYSEQIRAWQVFRYADASAVLNSPAYSADVAAVARAAGLRAESLPVLERLTASSFFTMPRARHQTMRARVGRAFSRRLVATLRERVEQITRDLLDGLPDEQEFDLLDRIAHPMPMMALCELLGIPHDDRRAFRGWADVLTHPETRAGRPDGLAALEPELRQLEEYLLELVRTRRRHPGADLLSTLAAADGEELADEVIVSLTAVLLLAGHNTTTMLFGNLVRCLDENPRAAADLRADRSLMPGALEEVLRHRGPLPRTLRLCVEDTRIGAHRIVAGQPLVVWTASANWDERQFSDPGRFDIRRSPNPHLGFGHGTHFCLGAPLARMVAGTAMNTLLDCTSEIEVSTERPLEYRAPRVNLGPDRLPVRISRR